MRLFDYIFYWITSTYSRIWPNDRSPWINGILLVSLFQFFTILSPSLGIVESIASRSRFLEKAIVILILVLPALFNHYRYLKVIRYEKLEERWGHEEADVRKRRGRLILIYFAVVFLIPIAFGILRYNLHWI